MDRLKALGAALVAAVIAVWGFYNGAPELLRYWGSAETIDCREFLAREEPSPLGAKLRVTNCRMDIDGVSGVSYGLSSDASELFLPLGPVPEAAKWELVLFTEDEALIEMLEDNSTALRKPRDFVGSLEDDDGDEFRTKFRATRDRRVVFLVEPSQVGMVIGMGLTALGLVCTLAALGGLFIAITGKEN